MNVDDDHVEAGLLSLRQAVRTRQLGRFVAQEERLGLASGDAELLRRAIALIAGVSGTVSDGERLPLTERADVGPHGRPVPAPTAYKAPTV